MIVMCNKGIAESSTDQQRRYSPPVFVMDGLSNSPASQHEESRRVKFLCSFSGSILPRPQDGKLRYVGGETRIVSVPRDIGFEDLMGKMRELFDAAAVLKYQQPDEDLDALVSVVNDEDVVNMMEEYDKLASAAEGGFTRLRIFLFSQPEHEASSLFEADERDSERRYVDALNSLNDGSGSSPVMSPVDDLHAAAEQYFNSLSLEAGGHRNYDFPGKHYGLRHLSIPHGGSGQPHHQMVNVNQRFGEVDSPWSPAYYSPRPIAAAAEFPSSPSSARFHLPLGEFPEEYPRDNGGWLAGGDKSGFPGNLFHGPSGGEGSSVCEHCRMVFQRNFEHPGLSNGVHQAPSVCGDCPPNADLRLPHHGVYADEHSNDAMSHERGWILQQQLNSRADEARGSGAGSVRGNEYYVMDAGGMSLPHGHGNYQHHRAGHEVGNELFHDQTVVGLPHIRVSSHEETGVRYGNVSAAPFVGESVFPTHGHVATGHPLRRNIPNQAHVAPQPYEAHNIMPQFNGKVSPGLGRSQWEGSPRFGFGMENQGSWSESSKMSAFEGKAVPEYAYGNTSRLNSTALWQENQLPVSPEFVRVSPDMMNAGSVAEPAKEAMRSDRKSTPEEEKGEANTEKSEAINVPAILSSEAKDGDCLDSGISSLGSINSSCSKAADVDADFVKQGEKGHSANEDLNSIDKLSVLPELIASAKKAALDGLNDLKAKVEENSGCDKNGSMVQELAPNEVEYANAATDIEFDSDSDVNPSTIEPTKAEAEAIDKGLQTIKNDDLEECKMLGSGTYGAVYHGKWRGSDVAIKRIKASCFAGKPSERERLIADFWKEALILSSLHHPNVVSFYGIVRDGPDGSLATVTEFMINGSLKQFLRKKDRTIDRRKRLIIALDAAIGMEYLHGKNIVHFDLKCENLLVNMRDPHRPICKIGDLGLSKVKQHTLVSGGIRGTLPWMAPELLSGKNNMVSEKIDVYSFGIVMWEVLTGDEPYADMHCAMIIGGIVNNTLRPVVPSWCDPEWKSLMESCWAGDPAERPSFSEISQKLQTMAAAMNVK